MSVSALLRFTPIYTPEIVHNPKLVRSLMVQRGALETIRRDRTIPVLVDHDESRVVGTVREIFEAPDYGGGDWYWASVEITDPPGWLKRNGGVSWSHNALHTQDVNGTTRLLRGIIREISILSPSVQPAEGRARVEWISSPAAGRGTKPSDRTSSPAITVDERFDDELSRLGYRGGDVDAFLIEAKQSSLDRLYEEHIAAKRGPQVLVRRGIGQVTGIR